ncbi:plasmid pRiA4b ORF-3 family protein [Sulfurimonas sp. NW15]|uniref:plasmid pRiA4b ORF-3 family protein n=1 Tax=Sulfurimonas sp. NW15 TaxID=2922729 RepID=UPI003DA8468D
MNKFDIQKIISSLREKNLGGLVVKEEFTNIDKKELQVPILDQMDTFLNGIDEKGLKLTTKGKFPTALVQEISLVNPSYEDQRFLKFIKRFIEDESISAQRARVLAKNLKLIKTSKNRLFLTPKAKAYQALKASEKFIVLFDSFLSLNLGYFDGMDNFDLLNELAPLYLNAIAQEKKEYRSTASYNDLFFSKYPQLEMSVLLELLKSTNIRLQDGELLDSQEMMQKVTKRELVHYVEIRLFKRFFALFGLLEERGDRFNKEKKESEPYEAQKSSLLEKFLKIEELANTDHLLTKKLVHTLKKDIQDKNLDINTLFHDFVYLMSTLANHPFPPTSLVVEDIIKQKMIIGTQAENQTKLYTTLYEGLKTAVLLFTQYATASHKEQLMKQFQEFIEAVTLLVDSNKKPFLIYKEFEAIPLFLLELLSKEYGVDITKGNPDEIIEQHFNKEVAEDIEMVFGHLSALQKESKKLKRTTKDFKQLIQDTVRSYILAIFSLYTYKLENAMMQNDEKLPTPKNDGFSEKIFEFKITLLGIDNPTIYRTIQVPSNFTFYDLHLVIQNAFNWDDAHLFEFIIKKKLIADHEDEFGEENILSARDILLEDEFKRKSQKAIYIYDFGDHWEHEIVLKKSFPPEAGQQYPACIDAQGNTPPEDVGGVWGFEDFKKTMSDKNHPEYLEMKEWYDRDYDPNECSIDLINTKL